LEAATLIGVPGIPGNADAMKPENADGALSPTMLVATI
jgi:hypothetical protein